MDSPHRFSAGLVDMLRWLEGITPLQVLLFRISKVLNKSYRISMNFIEFTSSHWLNCLHVWVVPG